MRKAAVMRNDASDSIFSHVALVVAAESAELSEAAIQATACDLNVQEKYACSVICRMAEFAVF